MLQKMRYLKRTVLLKKYFYTTKKLKWGEKTILTGEKNMELKASKPNLNDAVEMQNEEV